MSARPPDPPAAALESLRIVGAAPEHLALLAAKVGHEPLFARYRMTAESLTGSWTKALGRGEGLLVALGPDGPEGLAWFSPTGAFCRAPYLRLLVVAPANQSRGAGRRLLAAFEAACRPAPGGWFILCSDFNLRAQRFYQTSGYQQVGRLPDFVLPGVAEIILHKPAKAAPDGP